MGAAFDRLVERLEQHGCRVLHGKARCPAHPDAHPSLSVHQGERGAVIKCHAGCAPESIVAALDLTLKDLFDDEPRGNGRDHGQTRQRVAEYVYTDRNGEPLATKVRYAPKDFRWERSGSPKVLYRLPELVESDGVVVFNEGEKASDALIAKGIAATCAPTPNLTPELLEPLRGRDIVIWQDRDAHGREYAPQVAAALRDIAKSVHIVQSATTGEHHDAYDHLAAGFNLEDAVEIADSGRDPIASRFESSSIAFAFEDAPPPRRFLLRDFQPEGETGLTIARGGTGKGHLQIRRAVALALGQPFGPFEPPRPRGALLVSLEETRDEFHRRLWDDLRLNLGVEDAHFRARLKELRETLVRRIGFVSLRGLPNVTFETIREPLLREAERIEDLGLVYLDPIGRFVPQGVEINTQAGAAYVVGALDRTREETGAFVEGIYHMNKLAIREGGELRAGASSGSLQLEDLARWVLNGRSLEGDEPKRYSLPPGRYVQLGLVKSNYTPGLADPLIFRRGQGGALVYANASTPEAAADRVTLAVLFKLGRWVTRETWEAAAYEVSDLGKTKVREARVRLEASDAAERVEVREGRRFKDVFAPASRPTDWPGPPTKIAEVDL